MRSAVLGDVLDNFTLTAPSDQLQHLEADQLEGVAVRPARAIIIATSLGGSINARVIDSISLGAHILLVIVVTLVLGSV